MSAIYSDKLEGAAFINRDVLRETEAAVERARVVGVLDAWAAKHGPAGNRYECSADVCVLYDAKDTRTGIFPGDNIDAARAAAAKAIESGAV